MGNRAGYEIGGHKDQAQLETMIKRDCFGNIQGEGGEYCLVRVDYMQACFRELKRLRDAAEEAEDVSG